MANEITSNIISQLGGGSGIDTRSLVNQLVELERAPQEQRLDRREQRLDAQISGLGMLRQAVDEFEGSLEALANPDTFNAKSASISDTTLMAVNSLEPDAVPGNYRVKIDQVAQSQSLSSGAYASLDSEVGTGSLTLRFGDWVSGAFTVDAEAQGATIEIDDSNNSLRGLRDAINDAGTGVQASIVGNEGSYQLLLTGPTGAERELEITATEGAVAGLANFNYNETQQNLTQQQEGKDAILRVNGLQVTRTTNTIDDVIDGMEFDIFNSSTTEEISINVKEDRSQSEQAIRDFVESYNAFYEEVQFLTSNSEGEDGQGSLRNDTLADNLLQNIRSTLGSQVAGVEGGFSALSTIGIRTKLDGTLQIVEDGSKTDFQAAMSNHFEAVKNLFVPDTRSSSSKVNVIDYSAKSQAGEYDVNITQEATKGVYQASPITVAFPLDTTGKDYSFTIAVDGRESAQISLPDGKTYSNGDELAADFQTLINSDASLKEGFAEVSVVYDSGTNSLSFESDRYGASSTVEFVSVGADTAELGVTAGAGTGGQNVAGTIDGREAFGFGNILRPALGDPAEGLAMEVLPGATSATIGFSRGVGSTLMGSLDTYLRSSGLIAERESNLKDDLSEVAEDREDLDRRSESFRAIQEARFRSMEQIVRSLNSTGDFLEGLNDRLPFTAGE
ncbi:flagellar filament capping protein FliD [Marinimicrobium locisalis]|uniref:flagellar filament capping protein FliD n=1 Tax=Marinimicrobium locisalis TaxID=546022 RepID=UPI0032218856